MQGRIQDFKLGGRGAHLKKMHRAEGGAKNFGVLRVKKHDFTPKNHILSNCAELFDDSDNRTTPKTKKMSNTDSKVQKSPLIDIL
jgi:hypothetical protein